MRRLWQKDKWTNAPQNSGFIDNSSARCKYERFLTFQNCWRRDGVFHIQMEAPVSCHRCPKCGNREVIHRGAIDRVVHAPPIGRERTLLFIKTPRLECRICEQVLNAVLPNVVPQCNHTKSLARLVIDLRKMMTICDAAPKYCWCNRKRNIIRNNRVLGSLAIGSSEASVMAR